MGSGSVRPAFQPRGQSTGQRSQFTCRYGRVHTCTATVQRFCQWNLFAKSRVHQFRQNKTFSLTSETKYVTWDPVHLCFVRFYLINQHISSNFFTSFASQFADEIFAPQVFRSTETKSKFATNRKGTAKMRSRAVRGWRKIGYSIIWRSAEKNFIFSGKFRIHRVYL